jgi:hypothetical protein
MLEFLKLITNSTILKYIYFVINFANKITIIKQIKLN